MERLTLLLFLAWIAISCESEDNSVQLTDFEGRWQSIEGEFVNHISFYPDDEHWVIHSYMLDRQDTLFSEKYRVTGDSANAILIFPNGKQVAFDQRDDRSVQFRQDDEVFILKLDRAETLSITLNNSRHEPYTLNYHRIE